MNDNIPTNQLLPSTFETNSFEFVNKTKLIFFTLLRIIESQEEDDISTKETLWAIRQNIINFFNDGKFFSESNVVTLFKEIRHSINELNDINQLCNKPLLAPFILNKLDEKGIELLIELRKKFTAQFNETIEKEINIKNILSYIHAFRKENKYPVCFLYLKDQKNSDALLQWLSQKGIWHRSAPGKTKTCQTNKDGVPFVSLTLGQLHLLQSERSSNSSSQAFSISEIQDIALYLASLTSTKESENNSDVIGTVSKTISAVNSSIKYNLKKDIKDEQINAFTMIKKLNDLGYSRKDILNYIKSDYEKAIIDGESKKLFNSFSLIDHNNNSLWTNPNPPSTITTTVSKEENITTNTFNH